MGICQSKTHKAIVEGPNHPAGASGAGKKNAAALGLPPSMDRKWSAWLLASLPMGLDGEGDGNCSLAAATVDAHRFVVLGGISSRKEKLDAVYLYDALQRQPWQELPSLPQACGGCAAVAVGEDVYVVGGSSETSKLPLDTIWKCNLQNVAQGWVLQKAQLQHGRRGCAAVAFGKLIYIVGGYGGSLTHPASKTVEVYHTQRDEMLFANDDEDNEKKGALPEMSKSRCDCAAVIVPDEEDASLHTGAAMATLVVVGGNRGEDSAEMIRISAAPPPPEDDDLNDKQDAPSRFWMSLPSLSKPRSSPCAAVLANRWVMVVGGTDAVGASLNAVEILDLRSPDPQKWRKAPPLRKPRSEAALVVCQQSGILVLGGRKSNSTLLKDAEYLQVLDSQDGGSGNVNDIAAAPQK